MKKAKNINERPMVIVSSTSTVWGASRDFDTKGLYLTKGIDSYEHAHPKPETLCTGVFYGNAGTYGHDVLRTDGTLVSSWEQYKHPKPCAFSDAQTVLELLSKQEKFDNFRHISVKRVLYTYTNSETLETTKDIKVAKSWFKGRDPLWIDAQRKQCVGVWVERLDGCVQVSVWYNDRIDRHGSHRWKQAERSSFRLYPDGTLSHFWKGKYWKTDRSFETKRQRYQSFDVRFPDFKGLVACMIDLRSNDASSLSEGAYRLSDVTLSEMKAAGFPTKLWLWCDQQRDFTAVNDLLSFIRFKQESAVPKHLAGTYDLLDAIPFDPDDESNYVISTGNGTMFRIPTIQTTYIENDTISDNLYQMRDPKIYSVSIVENERIWVSKDGKKVSCAKCVHKGRDWARTSIDLSEDQQVLSKYSYMEKMMPEELNAKRDELVSKVLNIRSKVKTILWKNLPVFSYYEGMMEEPSWGGLFSFLSCVQKAPALVDYLVKNKRIEMLSANCYHRDWYDVESALKRFGLKTSKYKERRGRKLWQNLGVTKEQFHYVLGDNAREAVTAIFNRLRVHPLPMPIHPGVPMLDPSKTYELGEVVQHKHKMYRRSVVGEDVYLEPHSCVQYITMFGQRWNVITYPKDEYGHTDISKVPIKYIKMLVAVINSMPRAWDFDRLMWEFDLSISELEIVMNRGLDLLLLMDYWGQLQSIDGDTSSWERIPQTQDELRQLHDEAVIRMNLQRQERYAQARARELERQASEAANYKKLCPKLKDFAMEDERFTVLIPQSLSEIVDEGVAMSHCVGSYTGRVSRGETFVFFLREKDNPERAFVTFNIYPSERDRMGRKKDIAAHKWSMDQAFAKHDSKPNEDAIAFLRKWAEANDVEFDTIARACI